MVEQDLIIESFNNIFSKYKKSKIVLYGTGFRTKCVIENFPEYNFIGVMDKFYNEDSFCGIPIITMEEVCTKKVTLVIVMAQPSSTKIIFTRIGYDCLKNGIKVCNLHGRDLFQLYKYNKKNIFMDNNFDISKETFINQIDSHDSISLTISEILFTTKYLNQVDFYEILAYKSKKFGIQEAEKFFKLVKEELNTDIKLDELYLKLAKKLSISKRSLLQLGQFEIETWSNMIVFRNDIVDGIKYAIDKNKKVYLYNDTRYSNENISKFIINDLELNLDRIYLTDKLSFDKVGKNNLFLVTDKNEKNIKNKCDTLKIKSPIDMANISGYSDLLFNANSVNERSMCAMFIARAFNSPFALYKSDGLLVVNDIKTFGYLFISPIAVKFVLWIIEQTNKNKYDTILFAARDGYLVQQLFNIARKYVKVNSNVEDLYFQTSRTVCIKSNIKNKHDIKWVSEFPFAYSPEQLLIRKFELNENGIKRYDEKIYKDTFQYALEYEDDIYKESRRIRNNYLKYIENLNLKEHKKYAFVDLASSGTCQYFLEKIMDFKLDGLYLCRYMNLNKEQNELNIKSVFNNGFLSYGSQSFLAENYMLLETIFTSFKPTLISFNQDGDLIYEEDTRNTNEFIYLETLQSCIKNYFKDFLKNIFVENENISIEFIDYIYSLKEYPYTREACNELSNLMLRDDLGQGMIPLQ
jgi:predicted HAD superfamily hydrolase